MLAQFNIQNPSPIAARRKTVTPISNPYAKRKLFQSTKPTGGSARAQIIQNVPSSTRYQALLPEEYEHKISTKHQGLFPISHLYEDPPEGDDDLLWIRVSAYGQNLAKLCDPNDESGISYAAVGHMLVDAARLVDKHCTLELVKAFETKITQERNDDRCMGVIAVRLRSEQDKTTIEKLNKAQEIVQTLQYTEAYLHLEDSDLPSHVKAFTFEICPLNFPSYIVFGLLHGADAQWYDRIDHIAYSCDMEDIYSSISVELPKSMNTAVSNEALAQVHCATQAAPS